MAKKKERIVESGLMDKIDRSYKGEYQRLVGQIVDGETVGTEKKR